LDFQFDQSSEYLNLATSAGCFYLTASYRIVISSQKTEYNTIAVVDVRARAMFPSRATRPSLMDRRLNILGDSRNPIKQNLSDCSML